MADEQPIVVRDNRAASRYEAEVEGGIAEAGYLLRGDTIIFTHTEVPEALEGRGIGSRLARFALDDARARGLAVIARCPFIAGYIQRHPEYQDLLVE